MAENIRLLPIWPTITLAWIKTEGAKKTIWAAIGIIFLILLLMSLCFGLLIIFFNIQPKGDHPLKAILGGIAQFIVFLFQMGLLFIGIKRASNLPINYRMVFSSFKFDTAVKLLGYYLLQFIILLVIFIPFILISLLLDALTSDISKDFFSGLILTVSSLAAFYIFLRMYLAAGFILDKKVNAWQAIKLSFLSTRSNFLRLLIITIIEIFIILISLIPFGIGIIWTFPFAIICYGVIYQILLVNAYGTGSS